MASPRRVSRVLYLLGRGRRAATALGFAEPELAHEMGERVGEARRSPSPGGARPRPRRRREEQQRKSLRRLSNGANFFLHFRSRKRDRCWRVERILLYAPQGHARASRAVPPRPRDDRAADARSRRAPLRRRASTRRRGRHPPPDAPGARPRDLPDATSRATLLHRAPILARHAIRSLGGPGVINSQNNCY